MTSLPQQGLVISHSTQLQGIDMNGNIFYRTKTQMAVNCVTHYEIYFLINGEWIGDTSRSDINIVCINMLFDELC
jgi:hypothetical protein